MSVIKTAAGWVELGASHPLIQAFETAGIEEHVRVKHIADPKLLKHFNESTWLTLMPQRIIEAKDWTPEQVRTWNVNLAHHVGVSVCVMPCRCPSDCSCAFGHHSHKTDLRTLKAGVALFGKYGPEWVI